MSNKINKILGNNIAGQRKNKGLTQEHLGELAGISSNAIARIEGGYRWPNLSTIRKIASALEVDETELFAVPRLLSPLEALVTLCQDYGFDPPKPRKPKKKSA
jgi:transcriptional regulator with XRE-family HTH domain